MLRVSRQASNVAEFVAFASHTMSEQCAKKARTQETQQAVCSNDECKAVVIESRLQVQALMQIEGFTLKDLGAELWYQVNTPDLTLHKLADTMEGTNAIIAKVKKHRRSK